MTIRVPRHVQNVDSQRLASVITAALLNPLHADSAAPKRTHKPGAHWLLWGGGRGPQQAQLD